MGNRERTAFARRSAASAMASRPEGVGTAAVISDIVMFGWGAGTRPDGEEGWTGS